MQPLLEQFLGRSHSLFMPDWLRSQPLLQEKIAGSRVLVVGAAGSIGSSFVKQLVPFHPKTLHLVDPAENNLVELVRDLRSSSALIPDHFKTLSIPMGSREFSCFLSSEPEYDYVVNFSALKHVRVERDPYSLMRMLTVNLFALESLLRRLAHSPQTKVFSVSSDKAVNPANLMGAGKALMERLLTSFSDRTPYSTARFANVAFSDGSLLHGFCRRFEKGQPLSAPTDVRRYFISYEESGQLCLLACFLGENREVFIPRMDPSTDLKSFAEIAELFLQAKGFEAKRYDSDRAARAAAISRSADDRSWPCHFSGSDTSGEKPFEEFVGEGERADFDRFDTLGVIAGTLPENNSALAETLARLEEIRHSDLWRVEDMADAIRIAVPELEHRLLDRNLDQKM